MMRFAGATFGKRSPLDADTTKGWPKKKLLVLAFSGLGVVYGDIGTSPLYAFASQFGGAPTRTEVLGAASVTFWLLTVILILKYVVVVLRANDHGEGGTFALYSLLCRCIGITPLGTKQPMPAVDRSLAAHSYNTNIASTSSQPSEADVANGITHGPTSHEGLPGRLRDTIRQNVGMQRLLLVIAVASTAMVLGDGVFTPSISVLSAVAGLTTLVPSISQDTIVAVTVAILVVLFCMQQFGTHKVSMSFAPIILLWFLALDAISVYRFAVHGGAAFAALNPWEIVSYFARDGAMAWKNLANAVLVVTGSEALFADMGHFSQASISLGAAAVVYPSLCLTYLSQAAYLLDEPQQYGSLYWSWVPGPIQWPMLILATAATIIASQALISASFSLVSQAMKLGVFPTMTIKHTRSDHEGQIYIPQINYLLMIACVVVVGGFQDTTRLGNAYGLTVVTVMAITTLLLGLVMLLVWDWWLVAVLAACGPLLVLELAIFGSSLRKVPHGAWVALVLAAAFASVCLTWWYVRSLVATSRAASSTGRGSLQSLLAAKRSSSASSSKRLCQGLSHQDKQGPAGDMQPDIDQNGEKEELVFAPTGRILARTGGVGVFYASSVDEVPQVLAHVLSKIPALPDVVVLLTVRHPPVSSVTDSERFLVRPVEGVRDCYHVVARYGYMDQPNHDEVFVKCMMQCITDNVRLQWLEERGRNAHQEQQMDQSDMAADQVHVVVASENDEHAAASSTGAGTSGREPAATVASAGAGPSYADQAVLTTPAKNIHTVSVASSNSGSIVPAKSIGAISKASNTSTRSVGPAEVALERAWRQGVVQVVASEAVHAAAGSGLIKQVLVNGVFPLLTPGAQRAALALNLAPGSTLEVVLAVGV